MFIATLRYLLNDSVCTLSPPPYRLLIVWKAAALNVRVHIRTKFPVVVTLPMFIKSILESIHSWSIYHMLRQSIPDIDYSIAVEMLSNIESDIWFITISKCNHTSVLESVTATCSRHSTSLVSAWTQASIRDSMHTNVGHGWRN